MKHTTPTRVDISVVCTQDRGHIDDPIMNALRAAINSARTEKGEELGLTTRLTFRSEVKRGCASDLSGNWPVYDEA